MRRIPTNRMFSLMLSGNIDASGRCKILSQPDQSPRPTHTVSCQSKNFAAAGQISPVARASFSQSVADGRRNLCDSIGYALLDRTDTSFSRLV